MSILAVNFLLVLAICLIAFRFANRPSSTQKAMQKRLKIVQPTAKTGRSSADLLEIEKDEERTYAARLGVYLQRYSFAKKLETLLLHAQSGMSVGTVVLASAGSALLAALLVFLFVGLLPIACLAFLAGAWVPYLLLKFKRSRRLEAFNKALPEALDLMARSLRAGHSMGSSMELIGDQSPEPLGGEFLNVFQQQKFGMRFRDALLEMGTRTPSADLQFLITAILVQRETGGDLTEILDRTAHLIRERVRIEAEVKTYTAQGRLTGWILSLMPVVMLLLINFISPGYSQVLFHDPTGQKMLYTAGGMIVVGAFVIRKVVDVKV